ncbi:hypothetical protein ROZALSC1DRAFT_27072 [Rozella allomycis CSF55]|uniref:Uncharacterized protein n=1 Tax=Rozella allomycis (strain CSF55) TaxID=988480 RepID=A0A075AZH1_ROZAC|nr:hypothetical protein O9G_002645 [Rozella allomycis CSF55]RKP21537.1 hypothetical protein ROZALSC1DRAFT_27072 [Rozella allomycis CSF55]|eukprot:EPZ35637.1 hypothetical protein O9G_002645 [Rozella allomycis CSF55]
MSPDNIKGEQNLREKLEKTQYKLESTLTDMKNMQMHDVKSELADSQSRYSGSQSKLRNALEEIEFLKDKINNIVNNTKAEIEREKLHSKSTIETYKNEMLFYEKECIDLRGQVEKLQNTVARTKESLSHDLETRGELYEQEKRKYMATISEMKDRYRKKEDLMLEELKKEGGKINVLEQKIVSLESQMHDMFDEKMALTKKVASLEENEKVLNENLTFERLSRDSILEEFESFKTLLRKDVRQCSVQTENLSRSQFVQTAATFKTQTIQTDIIQRVDKAVLSSEERIKAKSNNQMFAPNEILQSFPDNQNPLDNIEKVQQISIEDILDEHIKAFAETKFE